MKSCQHAPARRLGPVIAPSLALVGLVATLSACKSEPDQAPQPGPAAEPAQPAPAAPAPTPAPAPASAPAPEPLIKPFFWEVSRNGAVSHFLGTMHAKYQLAQQPPAVTERLDAAKVIAVEADISKLSIMSVMQQSMLPPEQSLRTMLGEEYWGKLVGALGETLPPSALERLQPWFVGLLVSMGDLIKSDQSQAMDLQILARAGKNGQRVVYLEEIDHQFKILTEIGDLESLKEALDDLDEVRRKVEDMIAIYGRGDFEAMTALMLDPEELRKRPEAAEKLLFERNRAWMKVLEPLLAEGGAFVAVGAGHFVGEQGLLSLLRAAGYEVRRIEP